MLRRLTYVVGAVVAASGVAMAPAIITSLIYQEWSEALAISLAAATTIGGYLGARDTLRRGERFMRVALVVAVLASATKLAWDALT